MQGIRASISIMLWIMFFPHLVSSQDPIPLPGTINSELVEYAPSISADGNTLVFQSNRDGRYKLYTSVKDGNGNWTNPKPISEVNDFGKENDLIGGPSISYDGNEIYFFATFGAGAEDLYRTVKEGNTWSDPIKLGDQINSEAYEGFPSISPDGKRLYFMRFAEKQVYEHKFCYQIFMSEKNSEGIWQKAVPLPRPINRGCEKCPRIMSDNETLIYSAVRGESTKKSNYDFFQSRLLPDGRWSRPVPLAFINSPNDDIFGSVPSQGDVIFLNVNKGNENQDIYTVPIPQNLRPRTVINVTGKVTEKETGNPLEASLIILKDGDTLNTGGLKSNPFDGNYTVILTEGHVYDFIAIAPGYTAERHHYDLKEIDKYRIEKRDIQLEKYTGTIELSFYNSKTDETIEALVEVNGKALNKTDSNTYKCKVDYGKSYTITATNPKFNGYSDALNLTGLQFENVFKKRVGLEPSKPVLEMVVTDQETKKPLVAKLLLFDDKAKKMVFNGDLADGMYLGDLNFNRRFLYRVTCEGFFYKQGIIDLAGVEVGENLKEYIELAPLKVGSKLILNNITFEFGSSELTPASKVELNNVYYILSKHTEIVLEIAAHTDNVGSHNDNVALSEERAHSVRDYLTSKGISEELLSYHGYGESQPLVSNNTEENRAKNRRVEFIVKEVRN
ncbi:MAG: OmpA family protein [bacterium]|nr:OmpA family protein [bacterium]